MFRSRLRAPARSLAQSLRPTATASSSTPSLAAPFAAAGAARHLHHVPALSHDYSEGVPNLMSAAGFEIAWTEYMTLTMEKLNALTAGTEFEDKDTKTISLLTAREPSQAPIFNYASMAHNNHFFFAGLSPNGTPMPDALRAELEASFSSIETLRREITITASAMFGPGFVWLVKAGPGNYKVLTTYLAGSPYPGAHWRAQSTDMNTVGNEGSARSHFRNQLFGSRVRTGNLPPGGIELEPLLCLNTWEHAWLLDWGVGAGGRGGKMAFADAWWELIDWNKVAQSSGTVRPEFKGVKDVEGVKNVASAIAGAPAAPTATPTE